MTILYSFAYNAWKKEHISISQIVVKNGDESHGTIRKKHLKHFQVELMVIETPGHRMPRWGWWCYHAMLGLKQETSWYT